MVQRVTANPVPLPPEVGETDLRLPVARMLGEQRALLDAGLAGLQRRVETLTEAAELLVRTLRTGHKVLIAGNGGSAAEAQHFAAELVGRFRRDRRPYPAIALSVDTSIVTAVANDYGFEWVFARQVAALGRPGDLFLAFSTSGESENLILAAEAARDAGLETIAVTGSAPSSLARIADRAIRVPVADTAAVQALHLVVTHVLCEMAESALCEEE